LYFIVTNVSTGLFNKFLRKLDYALPDIISRYNCYPFLPTLNSFIKVPFCSSDNYDLLYLNAAKSTSIIPSYWIYTPWTR